MDKDEVKDFVKAGVGGAAVVLLVAVGIGVVVQSAANQDLGTDTTGVSWRVDNPFLSRDLDAKVEGPGHRISNVHIIDPKSGDVIGDNEISVPYWPGNQDFQVVACVDGHWQASPAARNASYSTKGGITITTYTGNQISPTDIPELNAPGVCL